MKKLVGPICSFVVAIAMFIFLSIPCFDYKASVGSTASYEKYSAWKVLKDVSSDVNGYVLFKIFTIAMIVVAVLLIIVGLLLLLKNLGALKLKFNLNMLNNILLAAYVLMVVLALVGLFVMAGDMSGEALGVKVQYTVGIGMWLNVVFAVAGCLCAWLFAKQTKAKKKRK